MEYRFTVWSLIPLTAGAFYISCGIVAIVWIVKVMIDK